MPTPRTRPLRGGWEAATSSGNLLRDLGRLDTTQWSPAPVPGHWQTTEHFGTHTGTLSYRHRFAPPDVGHAERCWLRLDGIFYQGDVWLDGDYVGDTEGYFFAHDFDVTERMGGRPEHELVIDVVSNAIGDPSRKHALTGVFQYGDFFPSSANPGGIWDEPQLRFTGPVTILHSRVLCRAATADSAVVDLRVVLDSLEAETVILRTCVAGVETKREQVLAAGENRIEWSVTVPSPDLWWPHTLGDQPLHPVTVDVLRDGGTADGVVSDGVVSDSLRRTIGLRSVSTVDGNVLINGERLYLKGACLGPTRAMIADATSDDMVADLDLALEAGLDMVSVHAHVARPAFYDHADRAGMLVWQDLPLEGSYARAVKAEGLRQAREVVDLLGHRPSVVAWCPRSDPKRGLSGSAEGRLAGPGLDRSLRRVLMNLDGTRPIAHARPVDALDAGAPRGYRLSQGGLIDQVTERFPAEVTRFGAPGAVELSRDEIGQWPRLRWQELVDDRGLDVQAQLSVVPIEPYDTLAAWVRATQAHQAQVMKGTVETARRNKYGSSAGYLQYYLRSSHPRWSYALVDGDRNATPAYASFAAASAPVIVIADQFPLGLVAGNAVELGVHIVSDLRHSIAGCRVDAWLTDPSGTTAWSWGGDMDPDSVTQVGSIDWTVPIGWGEVELELRLTSSELTVENRYQIRLPR